MNKRRAIAGFFLMLLVNSSFSMAVGIHTTSAGREGRETDRNFLTVYDFNGTTSPSSNHTAWYLRGMVAPRSGPPTAGPEIGNLTEFTTSEYMSIYKLDEQRVKTTSPMGWQLHCFRFHINENASEIQNLKITWYGHARGRSATLYIWNFKDRTWELVGVNRLPSDEQVSKTFVNGVADYINTTSGFLYLVAIPRTDAVLPSSLSTNYIQVKVGTPSTITLQDDAYHYCNEKKTYAEWWFFQVVNTTQDLQFYLSYYLLNPGHGFASVVAGVFEKGSIYEIVQAYPMSAVTVSYEKPDVRIGDALLTALDENTFLVKGSVMDRQHRAVWDLRFERTAPPYDFMDSPGETRYLCYMPGAWVQGTISLNGIPYSVNHSYGYHDHNWGGGPYIPCQWAWAAACVPEDGFALAMEKVEHATWHTRNIVVAVGDEVVSFENIQTTFKDFRFDVRHSFPLFTYYPMVRQVHAETSEGYALDFEAVVQKNLPGFIGYPRVLNEQVSVFHGALSKDGHTVYSFNVTGFTDYSV